MFPSGLPSKYYPGPMLLNFSDRTRTGAFNMVWPLTRNVGKNILLKLIYLLKLLAAREKSLEPVAIFAKSKSTRRRQSYTQNSFQNGSKRAV